MTNSATFTLTDDRLERVLQGNADRAKGPARTVPQPTWRRANHPDGPYRNIGGQWRRMRYSTASPSQSVRILCPYSVDADFNPFDEELAA